MEPSYKEFAIELARQAGEIMRKNFTLGMKREWKDDNTPLTATDKTINSLVLQAVKARYPGHSIIAEEGSHIIKNSEYVWVCDPVDGTIPFSHGISAFSFSLALTKNGESVLGVVYEPIMSKLFIATKGQGAYCNDIPITVSKSLSLESGLIYSTIGNATVTDVYNVPKFLGERGALHINICSSVLAGALVSCGEFLGAIHGWNKPWDGAAVKIIVEEAGGKVTDILGKEQRYDEDIKGFIASNGLIHDKLVELVQLSIRSTS